MDPLNDFRPENLSPRPITPHECPLPYGLSWGQLIACLADFDGQRTAQARCFESHAKQGRGVALGKGPNTCIVTLRYPEVGGGFRDETVFLKNQVERFRFEEQRYRFLASRGVPTPNILVAIHEHERELLVLEFLPTIGINFDAEVDDLLRLVARWNAIQDPPAHWRGPPGIPEDVFDAGVEAGIADLASDPSVSFAIDVGAWFAAYKTISRQAARLPRGLTHGEFFVQQVGWSQCDDVRRLVVFDVESMEDRRERFFDIAGLLWPLSMQTGRTELDLFDTYLRTFCELSGSAVRIDEALHEVLLIRVRGLYWDLRRWGLKTSRRGDAEKTDVLRRLHRLRGDLTELGMLPLR